MGKTACSAAKSSRRLACNFDEYLAFQISQFQKNAADLPWAHAVATLEGTGALLTGPEAWTATANFPASSGEVWMAGRADVAVDLVTRALASEVEKTLEEYLRRVEDGSAIRAVS